MCEFFSFCQTPSGVFLYFDAKCQGDSVRAYTSTFFTIEYKHDFSSLTKLWEEGIVPSFDGRVWRLHTKDGIALEISKEELGGERPWTKR